MKASRVASALRGLMQARASGRLNIIMNITPQVLNLPHDRSIDAKVTQVSPTGETTLYTEEGEIKILTSRKLKEGQDFKLTNQKENGSVQIVLKSPTSSEEIVLKMPGDFKKMLTENIANQKNQTPNYNKYKLGDSQAHKAIQQPNTSLFTFLTFLDKKSITNELNQKDALGIIPDIESLDFLKKISKLVNTESELFKNYGDLEYVHNLKSAHQSLSTEAWKFFCIPYKFKEQLHQMKLIIEDQENPNYDWDSPRKFWIEINPERLGRIQIDGIYSHNSKNTKTILNLSAEKKFRDDITTELTIFSRTLASQLGIELTLNFIDYERKRDDAFQVLLENYCRNKVSDIYV